MIRSPGLRILGLGSMELLFELLDVELREDVVALANGVGSQFQELVAPLSEHLLHPEVVFTVFIPRVPAHSLVASKAEGVDIVRVEPDGLFAAAEVV
jgi:hypothetical protein